MSKKQEGNIQYVNFKQEQKQTVISEKTLGTKGDSKTKKHKVNLQKANVDVKTQTIKKVNVNKKDVNKVNLTQETEQNTKKQSKQKTIAVKTEVKSDIKQKTPLKIKKTVQAKVKSNEVKSAKIIEMQEVQSNTLAQTPTESQNKIREFMTKYEVYSILDGKQKCNLAWSSDATNKEIYTKAVRAIVKASKSAKRFKIQAAS